MYLNITMLTFPKYALHPSLLESVLFPLNTQDTSDAALYNNISLLVGRPMLLRQDYWHKTYYFPHYHPYVFKSQLYLYSSVIYTRVFLSLSSFVTSPPLSRHNIFKTHYEVCLEDTTIQLPLKCLLPAINKDFTTKLLGQRSPNSVLFKIL